MNNNIVIKFESHDGMPSSHYYFSFVNYLPTGEEFTMGVPYDLTVFPIVNNKIVIDLSLSNPYDCIILFTIDSFTLIDEAGRTISFNTDSLVLIDGVVSPCCVTDNYLIVFDYNYFRVLKRSSFPQSVSIAPASSVPLLTLNGNGSEYPDGTEVTVSGRTTVYSVVRSYMGLVQDNSYTVFYDLSSTNGSKLTVPEALLTQYVAPVIVP